jgi:glycosyltransferase involved in cell wall biosynthesis
MAALQQGVATVSTCGSHTDSILKRADGQAFLLAPDDDPTPFAHHACQLLHDPARRSQIARSGQALYEAAFGWNVLAAQLVEVLRHPSDPSSGPPR